MSDRVLLDGVWYDYGVTSGKNNGGIIMMSDGEITIHGGPIDFDWQSRIDAMKAAWQRKTSVFHQASEVSE